MLVPGGKLVILTGDGSDKMRQKDTFACMPCGESQAGSNQGSKDERRCLRSSSTPLFFHKRYWRRKHAAHPRDAGGLRAPATLLHMGGLNASWCSSAHCSIAEAPIMPALAKRRGFSRFRFLLHTDPRRTQSTEGMAERESAGRRCGGARGAAPRGAAPP